MAELVECQHCEQTGTCNKGQNGESCKRCVGLWTSRRELANGPSNLGLVCSICWGKGWTEPSSAKWNYRYPAMLALTFVVLGFLLLFVFGLRNYEHFDKILVFVSTLVGSITGYYFGAKASPTTTKQTPTKANEPKPRPDH